MRQFAWPGVAVALVGAVLWQTSARQPPDGDARAGVAVAHAADRWETVGEPFRWSGKLASGSQLSIEVVNGSIDAEPAKAGTGEVEGEYRAYQGEPIGPLPAIRVEESRDKVRIFVDYPENYPEVKHVPSVHFRVRVPAGVTFGATTVNGSIRAEQLAGPIEAETVNGSIRVSGPGAIQATAVSGSIRASSTGSTADSPILLETVNGAIELRVPPDRNADLSVSTVNGAFDTDLPVSVRGRLDSGSLEGKLGKGGARIRLSTVNGSIRVLGPDA